MSTIFITLAAMHTSCCYSAGSGPAGQAKAPGQRRPAGQAKPRASEGLGPGEGLRAIRKRGPEGSVGWKEPSGPRLSCPPCGRHGLGGGGGGGGGGGSPCGWG